MERDTHTQRERGRERWGKGMRKGSSGGRKRKKRETVNLLNQRFENSTRIAYCLLEKNV